MSPVHPTVPQSIPPSTRPGSSSPFLQSWAPAFLISPALVKLVGLFEAVCTVCRETKWLSLSAPPGYVCFTCRMSPQPRPTRRSDIRCRGCNQTPAETGDDVSALAVVFTCVSCLMRDAEARPTCRRCLGAHWDGECEYNVAEAKAAHAVRVTFYSEGAARDQQPTPSAVASAESKIAGRGNAKSGSSSTPPTNKPSRRGRPRVDPTWKRAGAAARQRAYRERQRSVANG